MNNNLKLRTNSDIVNQYAKKIVAAVLAKISIEGKQDIGIFDREFDSLGIPGIKYLISDSAVAIDYGWLLHPVMLDTAFFRDEGKHFEGIYRSKSNTYNWDRSTFVKCFNAVKGQKLIKVTIHLLETYEENVLVINQRGKIISCGFAQMYSHNWNGNSQEAINRINFNEDDFEDDHGFDYDKDEPFDNFDSELEAWLRS